MTFLDRADPDVLVYRRPGAAPVTVLVNFSGKPQRVKADIVPGTVRTLAATDPALARATTLVGATLPPYATWIVTPVR
jgi:alpha-glucosidase